MSPKKTAKKTIKKTAKKSQKTTKKLVKKSKPAKKPASKKPAKKSVSIPSEFKAIDHVKKIGNVIVVAQDVIKALICDKPTSRYIAEAHARHARHDENATHDLILDHFSHVGGWKSEHGLMTMIEEFKYIEYLLEDALDIN